MKHMYWMVAQLVLILIWNSAMAGVVDESPKISLRTVLGAPARVGIGQPFLVRLTSEHPLDHVLVRWMGKEISPSISSWNRHGVAMVMLGTDVLTARAGNQELWVKSVVKGKTHVFQQTIEIFSKSYPRQDLTLPEKMVTPPKNVLTRIRTERQQTQGAKNTLSAQRYWNLPFQRPVTGKITSLYGLRRYLNKKPKNPHRGLDFRSPKGNPVRATAPGRVILVGNHYYAGNSIYLDHGNGVISLYFHLENPLVKIGDKVKGGEIIAQSGVSGRATGPHLHFSVSVQGDLVDPEPLFDKTIDQLLE